MNAVITPPKIGPDQLLELPENKRFELVDGNLVERPLSVLSTLVECRIATILDSYCHSHNLGWVWTSSLGCRCFPDYPDKVRRPDVTFVRRERLAPEQLKAGFLTIAPDLVVEVISPNDLASELEEKVEEYLAAGVALVWVVNPERRVVTVHGRDGAISKFHEGDEISGEAVLPEFRCRLAEFFPPKPPAS